VTWQQPPILSREVAEEIVSVAIANLSRQHFFLPGTAERAGEMALKQGSKEAVFTAIKDELSAGIIDSMFCDPCDEWRLTRIHEYGSSQ
jgi:hypothetical protein